MSKCSKQEAIEYNYGGQEDEMTMTVKHCTNAYMLVYIRDSEMKNVLQEVTKEDIPTEVLVLFKPRSLTFKHCADVAMIRCSFSAYLNACSHCHYFSSWKPG